jgi:hypothetical protein
MAGARRSPPQIFPEQELLFAADVGEPIELAVRALREPGLRPARGVDVRFEVVTGPLRLGPRRFRSSTVRTDGEGRAAVSASFTERGAAIAAVDRVGGDQLDTIFLGGHSDGTTHRLALDAPAASVAEGGIRVRVTALDHHGRPVADADVVLEAGLGGDVRETVDLVRVGPGEFEGILRTTRAGSWHLRAQDRLTHVIGDACTQLIPGPPVALRVVGEPDPRRDEPFSEVWLRSRLEDRFGNAIEPQRITCDVEGAEVVATVRADGEARFLIQRTQGHGTAVVKLGDSGKTRLTASAEILFAAAWIGDPGLITTGSTFRTPVYLMPAAGRPLTAAKVSIAFNRRRTRFSRWRPARDGPPTAAEAERDRVVIAVEPSRPIPVKGIPEGVQLGEVEWECTGEGETCFEVSAELSPASAPFKLCPAQKRARARKCICINIIYRTGDVQARVAGSRVMRPVARILSSTKNVSRCCPSLRLRIRYCRISAADWRNRVVPATGEGIVNTDDEIQRLFDLNLCQRDKCINFLMINIDRRFADGVSSRGPRVAGGNRSFGVINPESVGRVHNLGAHEVGHALGLDHLGDPGENVMSENQPLGDDLTEQQCEDLFRFLDTFAC